jgi:hypothetical protein
VTHRFDRIAVPVKHSISESNFNEKMSSPNFPSDPSSPVEPVMPQELFVEMDELQDGQWQEQARWIKYEEDLLVNTLFSFSLKYFWVHRLEPARH